MKERQTHGGKGDLARAVDKAKFDENFDKIFGKKDTTAPPVAEITGRFAGLTGNPAKEVG